MFIHDLEAPEHKGKFNQQVHKWPDNVGEYQKSFDSRFIHDLSTLENSKRVYQQVHTWPNDNLNIFDKFGYFSQEKHPIRDFGNSYQWRSTHDNFLGNSRANKIEKLSVGSNNNWTYTVSVGYNQLQTDWCQLQLDFKGAGDDPT